MIKKIFVFILCFIPGVLLHGWTALALYYCVFPAEQPQLRLTVAIVYLIVVLALIIINKRHLKAFFITLLGFVLVALWFASIQPKTGDTFPPELTLPVAHFQGDKLVLENVRNSIYRTKDDFDVRYETRTYNLNDVRTLDVMTNYWGMDAIAHTFLSFGFADGQFLSVSVEIRPAVGKVYDMLQGFFKQYQLIYIWADDRDLIRLRTNYKNENVYLYRTTFSPEQVRKMLVSMLKATSAIYEHPQFYNTLTQSCTNTLGNHIIATRIAEVPFWKRKVLTGDVDKRMYENGWLVTNGLSFSELRKQAQIDGRAKAADQDPQFSQKIRTHLKQD